MHFICFCQCFSHLQVTLAAWQEFDSQQEAVHEFVHKARSTMERDLNFSSPESLAVELDQARVSSPLLVFVLLDKSAKRTVSLICYML